MKLLFCALVAAIVGGPVAGAPATMPWIREGTLRASAVLVLGEMRNAEEYGLRSRDYDADALLARSASPGPDPASAAALDADVSRAIVRFATHLHSGRVDPRLVGHDLDVRQSALDGAAVIRALSESARPLEVLASYEPELHHYHLLRAALARYRAMAADGDSPVLPSSGRPSVKPGEFYAGMRGLRARLAQLGDLEGSAVTTQSGDLLDAVTAMALVRFQSRHRLDIDGELDRATIDALNVPLARRVRQIEFAIERSRWLPPRLANPPIIVNIPHFELFAFRTTEDRESDILVMDVVVGKIFPENNTPVFAADMRQVVLRPYWDVPRSILLAEYLPQMRAKEGWVAANDFEIVRGAGDDAVVVAQSASALAGLESRALRLRQKPGPRNALGNAKFLFPNRYNVYLHDTPTQGTFAQSRRAASHGCVRVSDPVALARHVLRNNPEWTAERIAAAMNGDTPTRITLAQPIRVFMIYATALALEDGRVLFFEDIYHHDENLARVW